METTRTQRSLRSPALALVGVLIIVAAIFAYYYTSETSLVSSLTSQVSSLQNATASLSGQLGSGSSSSSQSSQNGQSTTSEASGVERTVTVISTTTTTAPGGETVTVTSVSTSMRLSTTTETVTAGGPDISSQSGTLQIQPSANDTGTVTVSVTNDGYDPITGITVTVPTGSDPSVDLCGTSCPLEVLYDSALITPTSPLAGGETASGTASTTQGQVGTTYSITIEVMFSDGTQQAETIQVAAQTA